MEFLLLYGSILFSEKEAGDIDAIGIVSNKKDYKEIDNKIIKIQKTQIKSIHLLSFTKGEFEEELKGSNESILDAIKRGVILFGQDKFVEFIKGISK